MVMGGHPMAVSGLLLPSSGLMGRSIGCFHEPLYPLFLLQEKWAQCRVTLSLFEVFRQ